MDIGDRRSRQIQEEVKSKSGEFPFKNGKGIVFLPNERKEAKER